MRRCWSARKIAPGSDTIGCVSPRRNSTSLCPVTFQPDFAHFVIDYVPGKYIVESKSLKLFLGSFRNQPRRLSRGLHARDRQPRDRGDQAQWLRIGGYDDAAFRRLFSGSPVKRLGRDRFVRNVLIAIGNSAAPGLLGAAVARLGDPSPLVRAMAVWAVRRLAAPDEAETLAARFRPGETDPDVRAEWDA